MTDEGIERAVNVRDRRRGGLDIKRNQKVWVSWEPADSLVLTE